MERSLVQEKKRMAGNVRNVRAYDGTIKCYVAILRPIHMTVLRSMLRRALLVG